MKQSLKLVTLVSLILLSACTTQRYGRENPLSETERQYFTCRDIALGIASTEEFLSEVRQQRSSTSGAHVLGFLGDFGIGNVMEGDAAEKSGETRLKQLRDLQSSKDCEVSIEKLEATEKLQATPSNA